MAALQDPGYFLLPFRSLLGAGQHAGISPFSESGGTFHGRVPLNNVVIVFIPPYILLLRVNDYVYFQLVLSVYVKYLVLGIE